MIVSRKSARYMKEMGAITTRVFYNWVDRFFEEHGSLAAAHVVRTQLSGQPLARRSGNLARSVVGHSVRVGGVPGLRVGVFRGPSLRYARKLEVGGTIKPKKAQALSIPLQGGKAVTRSGVTKFGPRDFPGTLTFIPFRNPRNAVGVLIDETARQMLRSGASLSEVQAQYLLVKQVRIPAFRWLRKGMTSYIPQMRKALEGHLAELVKPSSKSRRRR